MSKRYWTSDIHFAHANIAKYCNRPTLLKGDLDENGKWITNDIALAAAVRMDTFLIRNLNSRIKKDDTVVHVGDYMNKGTVTKIPGLRNKPSFYTEQLNGTWIFLEGNHDGNIGVRTVARSMFVTIGPYRAFVAHYPIENEHIYHRDFIKYVTQNMDLQITGHVHNIWKHKFYKGFLMYNVGVDAHRFLPIHDAEIINDVTKIIKEK